MNILITGAFGNIGQRVLDAVLEGGHTVSVLDMGTKRNRRTAEKYRRRLRALHWGDIRARADMEEAVRDAHVVIHLAAIIPPASEKNPELCRAVNVRGTENLIAAVDHPGGAAIVYISSVSVMGPTQGRTPPRAVTEPVNPMDTYARTKVEAEQLLARSGVRHCILRLGAVMPTQAFHFADVFTVAFEIPLRARCEVVVDVDVATACLHAAEWISWSGSPSGRTFFIGGGREKGCQVTGREMFEGLLTPMGLTMPAAGLFATDLDNFSIDWCDTEEAQRTLRFQDHSFAEYGQTIVRRYRFLRPAIGALRRPINGYISRQSPYWTG
jgi:nucleoside-diphosphate-sugar epimerase